MDWGFVNRNEGIALIHCGELLMYWSIFIPTLTCGHHDTSGWYEVGWAQP